MAKKKKPSSPAPTKNKQTAAQRRKKRRRTKVTKITKETREVRQNPTANPPLADDITGVLLPGFGAFAATRVLQRMVYQVVAKRWPKLGKHAHALAGAASFGGVWFGAHRIRALAKYHDGIVLGSGMAALYGLAQCYLPKKYRWLIEDCKIADVKALPSQANGASPATIAASSQPQDEFSFLEEQLDELEATGSTQARTIPAPRPSRQPLTQAMAVAAQNAGDGGVLDPDLMEELGVDAIDDLYTGAFSTN